MRVQADLIWHILSASSLLGCVSCVSLYVCKLGQILSTHFSLLGVLLLLLLLFLLIIDILVPRPTHKCSSPRANVSRCRSCLYSCLIPQLEIYDYFLYTFICWENYTLGITLLAGWIYTHLMYFTLIGELFYDILYVLPYNRRIM